MSLPVITLQNSFTKAEEVRLFAMLAAIETMGEFSPGQLAAEHTLATARKYEQYIREGFKS